ncbi:hypothetical protein L323_02270 [Ruminiclostridium papyrosolvens C7]|uniref:Uncharacterized protein n=1 Tax=Ruminiclostridium papyrosolvens C7 TaxID=1330534 RepID=U4R5H6_9FIRM|nr:hypothetical protein L323_02270 [Ruminiclostridium papyrosolvens C7]
MTEIMQSIHKTWDSLIFAGSKNLELRKNSLLA